MSQLAKPLDLTVNTTNVTLPAIIGALNHDGSTAGFLGATPVAQAATIADPTGGAVADAEARTAINAILVVLEDLGLVASA